MARVFSCGLTAMLGLALLTSCSKTSSDAPSQVVASVDGDEVTESQVNQMLEHQSNVKPDQLEAVSRNAVAKLVQQQIVLRKAHELKLDRDQRVVQAVESAKREIVATAYLERIADGVSKPSAKDIQAYFDANPALFAERRIYTFQEVSLQADETQKAEIESQLTALKTPGELEDYLKRRGIAAKSTRNSISAENIPMQLLQKVAELKPGQGIVLAAQGGLRILMLLNAQSSPVTEDQARPMITAYLLNQAKRTAVEQELASLHAASKVDYFGKYTDLGASAPATGAAPVGANGAGPSRGEAPLPGAVGMASPSPK